MTVDKAFEDQLLASFEDEREFETLPIDEIQANLRTLGVDPAASISLAQGLATTPFLPVAKLLVAIEASEATERQFAEPVSAAIETASVEPSSEESAASFEALPKSTPRDAGVRPLFQAGCSWRAKLMPSFAKIGPLRSGRRKQLAFAACLPLLFLSGAAFYVGRLPPLYEAEALVMLGDQSAQPVRNIADVLIGPPAGEEGAQSQLMLIKSRSMAKRLVDQLNLDLLPEFNPALQPKTGDFAQWLDPAQLIPGWLLDHLPKAWADTLMTTISGVEMTDQERAALLRSEIVDRVMQNMIAEPANRSTVIALKFISTEPQLAALGANTLARLYLAEQLETKQIASRRAREFLENEIERLRGSVASAEQAIQDYRRQSGLGGALPAGLGGALPDEQQLSGLTTQLVLSRSERAQAEARLRQVEQLLNSDTDLVAAAQLLDSPVLNELRARELELNRQRSELSNEFGERHPRMVNLRAEQATLEQRKQAEIRQIAQRLRDEVEVLRSREATLEANIDGLKSQIAQYSESEIGLEALQREADADRELLETYINRAKEIASQQKAQEPDARVISRATLPDEPTYPRRALIFGAALLFGVALASLCVLPQLSRPTANSERRRRAEEQL